MKIGGSGTVVSSCGGSLDVLENEASRESVAVGDIGDGVLLGVRLCLR